jgi:hypothetical protein
MILRRTLFASLAAWIAAFPSRLTGFFRGESTEPLTGEREINIHLTWPGVRVNVTGTGFLCVTDKTGTQWSEYHGDARMLRLAFEKGVRAGVSRDEFPPMRAEALIQEAIANKDVELAETVIEKGWIARKEFEKQWMAYHAPPYPYSREHHDAYVRQFLNDDSYTYPAILATTGRFRKSSK